MFSSRSNSRRSGRYHHEEDEMVEVEQDIDWNTPARMSPTLGELLKHVGDSRRLQGDETPLHQVIEMNNTTTTNGVDIPLQRSVPFVLSFTNLTYSVKIRQKMKLPMCFRRKNKLGAVDDSLSNDPRLAKTKTLLNNISGEARDGEILAVLGASGSGKSTLIDALANRIAKGSLKGTVTLNGEDLQSRLNGRERGRRKKKGKRVYDDSAFNRNIIFRLTTES